MNNQTSGPSLHWEVRYSSDIAGRALFGTYSNVSDANTASLALEKSFRQHGLPSVAMSVSVTLIGDRRRES